MFCETYEHALKDAAVSGELPAKLHDHLAACSSCRTAFTEEQSLYAAINSALHAVANSEVPATLIPRVHIALNSEPIPRRTPGFWLFAAAPLLAAGLLVSIYLRPHGATPAPAVTPQNVPNRGASPVPAVASAVNSVPPRGVITLQRDRATGALRNHGSGAGFAEVIVEPQEAAALLRYEVQLGERSKPQTLLAKAIELPSGIQPLEIAELEVGDLKIPALAKAEADADKK